MSAGEAGGWLEQNQRYVSAKLAVLRERLRRFVDRKEGETSIEALELVVSAAEAALSAPSALDRIATAFDLTPFERDLLLFAAGVELDAEVASLCALARRDPRGVHPTWSLALSFLDRPHWSAVSPAGPLRRFKLVEMGSGDAITTSPLVISERVLHQIVGIELIDERLWGVVEPLPPSARVAGSQGAAVSQIAQILARGRDPGDRAVLHLAGDDPAGKRAVAATACASVGVSLCALRASEMPLGAADREALLRMWDREALLSAGALLIEADDLEAAAWRAVVSFAERAIGPIFIASRAPVRLERRALVRVEVPKPTSLEQRGIWEEAVGDRAPALASRLDAVVSSFNLGTEAIEGAAREALAGDDEGEVAARIWDVCRARARPKLDDLAQRIEPRARWEDLVLPDDQRASLRDIVAQVRQRYRVYETWGLGRKAARGLGVSALFSGPSGTGKTMAAEVLAGELSLDLYAIDLSQMVSKYIGETEKNLRRVFDAADEGGSILLFDEADALFGKRSEVKDSHDRYANIEVSYLLQRMEAYRGLAILTTNMKGALDTAFLRRLRFVVSFPFPDVTIRAEIWRRVFLPEVPTERLDFGKLARLAVAGGSIRNIALNGAFLAADAGEPVRMSHLLRAAKLECHKLDKQPTDAEIGAWV